jgi:hypothetical protein
MIALLGIAGGTDARAQVIDVDPVYGEARVTYPANAGAWPLLVGSTAVSVWNLVQVPMGRSRMWSVTGLGLGLAATGYAKITLDNGKSTPDLAMGTMTAGILTSAVAAIALLPREGRQSQSDLSAAQRGTLVGFTSLASMVTLLGFARNLEGSDQGMSAATVGTGLTAVVLGVGARAQAPHQRKLARAAVISGVAAVATGMITFARHPEPPARVGFDCTVGETSPLCSAPRRIPFGRIAF